MNAILRRRGHVRGSVGVILGLACIAGLIPVFCVAMPLSSQTNHESKLNGQPQGADVVVEWRKNLLTVIADNVQLETILASISSKTAITILLQGSAEMSVTARISNLPVEEAIKRLTSGSSYAFIYASDDPEAAFSRLLTVFVYSKSSGSHSIFGEPATALDKPISSSLMSDSEDSARALKTPEDKVFAGNEESVSRISDLALHGEKVETRITSIEFLASVGQEWVTDTLIQALRDNEARVRTASVQALGQYRGGKALNALRDVLNDPVPVVRKAAMLVIDQMDNGE
jgi:hypothetical protein